MVDPNTLKQFRQADEKQEGFFVVTRALGKEQIDEVIRLSEEYSAPEPSKRPANTVFEAKLTPQQGPLLTDTTRHRTRQTSISKPFAPNGSIRLRFERRAQRGQHVPANHRHHALFVASPVRLHHLVKSRSRSSYVNKRQLRHSVSKHRLRQHRQPLNL